MAAELLTLQTVLNVTSSSSTRLNIFLQLKLSESAANIMVMMKSDVLSVTVL